MRPLDGFHAQVEHAGGRRGADGGVAAVGEGAGLPVAETGHVVGVAAEALIFGCFELEGAELLVDDLPDDFVRGHCGFLGGGGPCSRVSGGAEGKLVDVLEDVPVALETGGEG